jgi:uncharacterized protein YodC (DUF2158 family)
MLGLQVVPAARGPVVFTVIASVMQLDFRDMRGDRRETAKKTGKSSVAIPGGLPVGAAQTMRGHRRIAAESLTCRHGACIALALFIAKGAVMIFEPGRVVVPKSDGPQMTVAEVSAEDVPCIWLSENGGLFRGALPETVLDLIPSIGPEDEEDDDEEEEDTDEEDEEDGEDEQEEEGGDGKTAARQRRRAA